MGWKYWKLSYMQSWDYATEEKNPDLLAIIERVEGQDYSLTHVVNMKNCGHYATLAEAKKAALMEGLADTRTNPISTEDGCPQWFIEKTI